MTTEEMEKVVAVRHLIEDGNPKTSEFLSWLADRLVSVYKEPSNIDFVQALRRKVKLIEKLEEKFR